MHNEAASGMAPDETRTAPDRACREQGVADAAIATGAGVGRCAPESKHGDGS
ncbi:hypothetical protein ACVK00_006519 [Burkholderia sp. PvR073]